MNWQQAKNTAYFWQSCPQISKISKPAVSGLLVDDVLHDDETTNLYMSDPCLPASFVLLPGH